MGRGVRLWHGSMGIPEMCYLFLTLFRQWTDMRGAAFVGQAAGYGRMVFVLLNGHTPCDQMKDGSAHGMEEESMRSGAS